MRGVYRRTGIGLSSNADFHGDGGRQGIPVKEVHAVLDIVLDEHPLGIPGNRVLGEKHRGLVNSRVGSSWPSSSTVIWRMVPS